MSERRYSNEHSWVLLDDTGIGTVGISEFAQEQLGDVIFVELPDAAREVQAGEAVGVIESVKTNEDFCVPVSGTIVEHNAALADQPELLNEAPLGDGWIIRIAVDDPRILSVLMDEEAYTDYTAMLG